MKPKLKKPLPNPFEVPTPYSAPSGAISRAPGVRITPTDAHPLPYVLADEPQPETFSERLAQVAATSDALHALGADIDITPETAREEAEVLREAVASKKVTALNSHAPAARAASAFLREYGRSLALDVVQVRTALTNKLLELADCGDPRFELRAIELLGKHSDIGLFTERSEVNINYSTSEGLEKAIKDRVKRLLNADLVKPPLGADLDRELGIVEGEYDEVPLPVPDPEEEAAEDDDEAEAPDYWPEDDDPDNPDEDDDAGEWE